MARHDCLARFISSSVSAPVHKRQMYTRTGIHIIEGVVSMARKKMVAMLLAGGEGKRLGVLTKDLAKPAVHFGGKYRIIDFTLSNCAHSGIDTVGVLTQYQPLILNQYLGIGSPWGLDRRDGGMSVLPPYVKSKG